MHDRVSTIFGRLIDITNDSTLGRSCFSSKVRVFSSNKHILLLYVRIPLFDLKNQKIGSFGPLFRASEYEYPPPFSSLQLLGYWNSFVIMVSEVHSGSKEIYAVWYKLMFMPIRASKTLTRRPPKLYSFEAFNIR